MTGITAYAIGTITTHENGAGYAPVAPPDVEPRHTAPYGGPWFSTDSKKAPVSTKWKFVLGVTLREAVASLVCGCHRFHAMESNDVEHFEIDLRRGRLYCNSNCGGTFVAGPRPADVLPLAGCFRLRVGIEFRFHCADGNSLAPTPAG